MPLFGQAPKPESRLGRYRALAPTCGLHVSPLALGAMSIGDQWANEGFGSMNKESSFKLLDAFYEMGGNFIDTANNYQNGSSEEFIGEWAEAKGIRDQLVIATKYTTNFVDANDAIKQKITYTGNNAKSMHISVEASLKKLRTSYIDILYVHWWDWDTPVEEVMNALHTLVQARKVLYLGISDTPAWIVSRANMYARMTGKTPFVIYQGMWNVLDRSFERDIIPMARTEGIALAPWGVLCQGKIRTDAEEAQRASTGEHGRTVHGPNWQRNETERAMSKALERIAGEVGAQHITSIAIAYVMAKTPYVFPLIGGRKVEQLQANVEALSVRLTKEHIKEIEGVAPFSLGFPHNVVGNGTETSFGIMNGGWVDKHPHAPALQPTAEDAKAMDLMGILNR
ncbi:arylalcohol dehydrogenase [Coniophora puteana RWD-64-598 SS2]|uniref:Arylalcohol dehydrogenase n=1 Tax=Coniophora puteana (strain RWD-64-598) TaxID=741705 RepID=A0A5M3MI19_CONPW|nr:arylalcohol dehydrogenase [Coniophora puteana RWD-64-598 SS2]EIW78687.1 arylalcohol dehydrogenase [Coniophora puteana RWD-64-598 SS2]